MAKKRIALLLAVCILCMLFAGCKSKITADQAVQIAMDDLGAISELVEQHHIHEGTYNGKACYNIYITINSATMGYIISETGKILEKGPASHSH